MDAKSPRKRNSLVGLSPLIKPTYIKNMRNSGLGDVSISLSGICAGRRRSSVFDIAPGSGSSPLYRVERSVASVEVGVSKWKEKMAELKEGKSKDDFASFMKDGGGMAKGGLPKIDLSHLRRREDAEKKEQLAKAVAVFKKRTAQSFQENRKLSTHAKDIINLKKYFDNLIEKSDRTDFKVSVEMLEKEMTRQGNSQAGSGGLSLSALHKYQDGIDFAGFLKFRYPMSSKTDIRNMMLVAVPVVVTKTEKVRRQVEVPSETLLRDLGRLWKMWDEDSSGELNKFEFKEALKSLGVDDFKEFNRLYAEIDLNNNGSIDQAEFMAWWVYGSAQLSCVFEPGGATEDEISNLLDEHPLSLPLINDYRVH